MYNADGFIIDDRAETEYPIWSGEPCMENCKESVEITMRASILDVTPEEETEAAVAVEETTQVAAVAEEAPVVAALDPELVAAGEKAFKKCAACHQVGADAKNRTGPALNGIMGAAAGQVEGFKYSKALNAMAEDGLVWDEANMAAFLTKPREFMKGTKMSFAGFRKESDLDAVIEYLKSHGE